VLIAIVIATPVAFIGMQKWLQNFAFQTKISWWIFLLGGCSMLLMALFTLAFQTIKAASANPVDSLRSE
jgi:putative ABC transport system permease protein